MLSVIKRWHSVLTRTIYSGKWTHTVVRLCSGWSGHKPWCGSKRPGGRQGWKTSAVPTRSSASLLINSKYKETEYRGHVSLLLIAKEPAAQPLPEGRFSPSWQHFSASCCEMNHSPWNPSTPTEIGQGSWVKNLFQQSSSQAGIRI